MTHHEIESSFIRSIAYSRKQHLLEVTFTSGETYQYTGVSRHRRDALMGADSKGRYFNAHIRKLPFKKL